MEVSALHQNLDAPTEPRSFERGEPAPAHCGSAGASSFNGATLLRAWRVLPRITAFLTPAASFNGATLLRAWREAPRRFPWLHTLWLQRSHAPSSVESFPKRGKLARAYRASTEPRSFERRELTICTLQTKQRRSFNGATLLRAWRENLLNPWRLPPASLQRSHAPSSVESLQRGGGGDHGGAASTEPRSFERGERLG